MAEFYDLVRNPTTRPPEEIPKVEWDPEKYIDSRPSWSYGKINFNIDSSSGRKPAKVWLVFHVHVEYHKGSVYNFRRKRERAREREREREQERKRDRQTERERERERERILFSDDTLNEHQNMFFLLLH